MIMFITVTINSGVTVTVCTKKQGFQCRFHNKLFYRTNIHLQDHYSVTCIMLNLTLPAEYKMSNFTVSKIVPIFLETHTAQNCLRKYVWHLILKNTLQREFLQIQFKISLKNIFH